MDRQLIIQTLIKEDLERCSKLLDSFERQKKRLPQGSLVYKYGRYHRAVRENGKQYVVALGDTHGDLLRDLKFRRYIREGLPLLKKRIRACHIFLESQVFYDPMHLEESLGFQYHGLEQLDIFLDGDTNKDDWVNENYTANGFPIDGSFVTGGGIKVRSKSEAFIGTRLEENDFIFRYETEVRFDSKRVFPDFAVLLPNRRRIVYWEHLGLADDPSYILKNLAKLEEYAKYGIYLGINLIITYETKARPLTIAEIDRKISTLRKLDRVS